MKKKSKIIAVVGLGLIVLGMIASAVLSLTNKSPLEMTKQYLKNYQNVSPSVKKEIVYPFDDKLGKEQQQRYIALIEKQYSQLTYEVVANNTTETDAIIEVAITVTDLEDAYTKAQQYVSLYEEKFQKDGKFNDALAIDYKLEQLEKATTKVSFGLNFLYYKKNEKWVMTPLEENELKRMQGIY